LTLRFPYERISVDPSYADPSPYAYRPVIPITIYGLTKAYATRGLLDTGAVETILPRALVEDGRVDPAFVEGERGTLLGPQGEPFDVVYGTVDLAMRLKRKTHRWHAKVAFSADREVVLLGDAGFLRYFTVTFNRPELYTTLRPNGRFPLAIMPAR
jgi:hypothetical protein